LHIVEISAILPDIWTLAVSFFGKFAMKRILVVLMYLLTSLACSSRSESSENDLTGRNKSDEEALSEIDNASGFKQLDSTLLIQLVLDQDHRFAIRHNSPEARFKTDTLEWHFQGLLSNKASGEWKDLGKTLKLEFREGTVDFFDHSLNENNIEIINDKTALLDKTATKVWIWKTECTKKTER